MRSHSSKSVLSGSNSSGSSGYGGKPPTITNTELPKRNKDKSRKKKKLKSSTPEGTQLEDTNDSKKQTVEVTIEESSEPAADAIESKEFTTESDTNETPKSEKPLKARPPPLVCKFSFPVRLFAYFNVFFLSVTNSGAKQEQSANECPLIPTSVSKSDRLKDVSIHSISMYLLYGGFS